MQKLILATSSPYRKEAFAELGIPFLCESSDIDERYEGRPKSPRELVLDLSERKARAVAKNHSGSIIIGFDSVAFFKGQVYEKPGSREEAFKRLKSFSADTHEHYTGLFLLDQSSGRVLREAIVTVIRFRQISDLEINRYLDQDKGFDTYALGYNPLNFYSTTFIKEIRGSYNNIIRGIPLENVAEMLKEIMYIK